MVQTTISQEFLSAIPNEIWLEIIWQACRIPGVDEFSSHFDKYTDIYRIEGDSTAITKREQLRIALECRLRMCLVCKGWSSLAYSLLWSHLRISLQDRSVILETLRRKPELGSYVRRITMKEQSGHLAILIPDYNDIGLFEDIVEFCPRLISLNMSNIGKQASYEFPPTLTNVCLFWQPSRAGFPLLPQSLTSLTIECSQQPRLIDSTPPLSLPNLHALNIYQLTLYESWVDGIVKNWDFPSLQTLVLSGGNIGGPMAILGKYASTLRIVKIYGRLVTLTTQPLEPIHLPILTRLDIMSTCDIAALAKAAFFPNLKILLLFWPYRREIPFFDAEKSFNIIMFGAFLHALHSSCPASVLVFFETGDFVKWLIRQNTIATILTEMRDDGRRLILPEQDFVSVMLESASIRLIHACRSTRIRTVELELNPCGFV